MFQRFKLLKNGYSFDRYLFNGVMLFIFAYLFYVAWSSNFDLNYFKCGDDTSNMYDTCKNPFFTPKSWINEPELPPGEYGIKPGPLYYSIYWVSFGLLILSFVVNHFIYNRGFFKGFKLEEVADFERDKDN